MIQSLEHGSNYVLRVDVAPDELKFPSDIVYVEYRKRSPSETRILEGDQVKFWGEYVGIYSYTATLGQTIQVPHVIARIVEDQGRYVRPAHAPLHPPKLSTRQAKAVDRDQLAAAGVLTMSAISSASTWSEHPIPPSSGSDEQIFGAD